MLPQRLRAARKEKKWTQEKLAKMIGRKNNSISNYEAGISEPNFDDLKKLSEALDVSIDWLLGKTDSPQIVEDEVDMNELFDKRIVKWKGKALRPDQLKEAERILEYILSLELDKDDKK